MENKNDEVPVWLEALLGQCRAKKPGESSEEYLTYLSRREEVGIAILAVLLPIILALLFIST